MFSIRLILYIPTQTRQFSCFSAPPIDCFVRQLALLRSNRLPKQSLCSKNCKNFPIVCCGIYNYQPVIPKSRNEPGSFYGNLSHRAAQKSLFVACESLLDGWLYTQYWDEL